MITTLKDQNVENQNVENQNVKKNVESLKMTFDVLILPMHQKRSERRKSKRSTTYGILPMCTKACGGLGKCQFG